MDTDLDLLQDDVAKRLLRAEMVKSGVSYEELAARLDRAGYETTAPALRKKMSRGRFTAEFFLLCLQALNVKILRLMD